MGLRMDEAASVNENTGTCRVAADFGFALKEKQMHLVVENMKVLKKLLQSMNPDLPDDEVRRLDRLAQIIIVYLLVVGLCAFFGACILSSRSVGGLTATDIFGVTLVALFGFAGSAVAALTSCLDRYANGFERGDGRPFPENIKEGVGKFNRRFARWLFARPFLGAIIAPVFVWGLSHFVSAPQKWIETIGFTAFVGGLLAKSVVDLIKNLFKNVFKA
jgi:hypothetical protein